MRLMKLALCWSILHHDASAFTLQSSSSLSHKKSTTKAINPTSMIQGTSLSLRKTSEGEGDFWIGTTCESPPSNSRRSFVFQSSMNLFLCTASTSLTLPFAANALPSITVGEFETILKSSAKSVQLVELSGPKSETARVILIDGTQFLISDLYESPTDPRSPLKLIATCRSYNVPTKSVGLEEALSSLSGSKKKRVYMNERVRIAAEKEREKKIRMEEDERERLEELEKMST